MLSAVVPSLFFFICFLSFLFHRDCSLFCALSAPISNGSVCYSIVLPSKSGFINCVLERGSVDGCVISNGVEGGTKVEGGVGKGGHSEVDGRFGMTSIDIGLSATGGDSTGSLGST